MAKSKMNIKYVQPKREKNKKVNEKNTIKKDIIAAICILLFIAIVYFGLLLLEYVGVFSGYEPSTTKEEISTSEILIGEVFNRSESEYYVLFENVNSESVYANTSDRLYTVDMSQSFNSKYISEEYNDKASDVEELKINDNTLIKITDGKITDYVIGKENIENYFE